MNKVILPILLLSGVGLFLFKNKNKLNVKQVIYNDIGYKNGKSFNIKLININNKLVELNTANAFLNMKNEAKKDNVNLIIESGFRTMEEQEYLYSCYIDCNCNNCNLAAKPGYSNHQSGNALDINLDNSNVYSWLKNNANNFGFYQTIDKEPWHWVYK